MNHVRRPLALAACVFLAAVFLAMLCTGGLYERALPEEGERLVTGVLVRREEKETIHGERIPVYYVKDDLSRDALVMCELKAYPALCPMIGARVTLSGVVTAFTGPSNPGEYDRRKYDAVMRIAYRLKEAGLVSYETGGSPYREGLCRLRAYAGRLFDEALPAAEAGILRAVILGDKSFLDADVKALYAGTGILHILAVSGLHVSLLGGMLYRFLLWLIPVRWERTRLLAAGLTVFVMVSYGLFTGMSASAFRAVVMFVMRVAADRLGRTYDIVTALSVAAALLVLEQPLYLFYSGFQFSFLAVLGVSVLYPALTFRQDALRQVLLRESRVKRCLNAVWQAFLASLSVTLMTLPVQLFHQFTAPVYAALLNLVVIPLMSVLFPAGLLVLAFGWSDATLLPAAVCRVVLRVYEVLCGATRTLPFATWYAGRVRLWQIVMYYVILAGVVWYASKRRGSGAGLGGCGGAGGSACGSGGDVAGAGGSVGGGAGGDADVGGRAGGSGGGDDVCCGWLDGITLTYGRYLERAGIVCAIAFGVLILGFRVPPRLQITMLDVGQGDGIVVQHRDGLRTWRFLIDGGSTSKSAVGSYQILPNLKHEGIGALDAVLISHEDLDHISGVKELLEETAAGGVRVRALFLPDVGGDVATSSVVEAHDPGQETQVSGKASARAMGQGAKDGYAQLVQAAEKAGVSVYQLHAGQRVRFGEVALECLAPVTGGAAVRSGEPNAHSMVLRLSYGAFTALFTGDVEGEGLVELMQTLREMEDENRGAAAERDVEAVRGATAERDVEAARGAAAERDVEAETGADVDLLKVSHHGSRGATDEAFLALTRPEVALISCGRDNRYGHPHAEVLTLLDDAHAQTFITATSGAITVRVSRDGRRFEVEEFLR